MVCDKTWFDHLVDRTGDCFCLGMVGGSALYMLKGMYNSPKGERLIRGSQVVRTSAPRCASHLAVWGGLSSVFQSYMVHVRQKEDLWDIILPYVAASGFLNIRQGLSLALRSTLIVGSAMVLYEGYFIVGNKIMSSVQSPQPDFELDKKQKKG